jgi:P pilus assembly chaperone PapD
MLALKVARMAAAGPIMAGAVLAALLAAAPAGAVGLGPLVESGRIDGPRKGFDLTLINPEDTPVEYQAYAIGAQDELPQPRVMLYPSIATLGPGRSRHILVIAEALKPGEYYEFRVCAQRMRLPPGVHLNARVCSKLSVRRVR